MKSLTEIIASPAPSSILVLGDLMLDEYCWGSVDRISPEGPIPILNTEKIEYRLGGAASSCLNLAVLGCRVYPVGIIGEDIEGQKILEEMQKVGMHTEGLVKLQTAQTTLKRRLLTKQQQLLRVDTEKKPEDSSVFENSILKKIESILPTVQGVLISDYAKGVCTPNILRFLIKEAKAMGLPIICDPGKGTDYSIYRGITAIKPNRKESEEMIGKALADQSSILKAAKEISEVTEAEFLLLSLDRSGVLFYRTENNYRFIAADVREVSDVTGAGDMMVSTAIALLAAKVPSEETAQIANYAANLEVTKLGASPLTWSEIENFIRGEKHADKIISVTRLKNKLEKQDQCTRPLIFLNGYFDDFNSGVLKFLLELNRFYGTVVVGINSDASILSAKGKAPLLKENHRAEILSNIRSVDFVVFFDEENAISLIEILQPDIYVKSEIFRDKDFAEKPTLKKLSTRLEYLPYHRDI